MADFVTNIECQRQMHDVWSVITGSGTETGMRQDIRVIRETQVAMLAVEEERKERAELDRKVHADQLTELSAKISRKSLWVSVAALALTAAGVTVAIFFGLMSIKLMSRTLEIGPKMPSGEPTPMYSSNNER